jgi:hypothetical protein
MARARNIKPGFFTNDDLAALQPLARLLFAGLWCIADREGRLEDRPAKIKAEVLPYDQCDAEELLQQLTAKRFLTRYESHGTKYIQINNFERHQSPHPKEAKSVIPKPPKQAAESKLQDSGSQPESNLQANDKKCPFHPSDSIIHHSDSNPSLSIASRKEKAGLSFDWTAILETANDIARRINASPSDDGRALVQLAYLLHAGKPINAAVNNAIDTMRGRPPPEQSAIGYMLALAFKDKPVSWVDLMREAPDRRNCPNLDGTFDE